MGRTPKVCSCIEHGCNNKTFEDQAGTIKAGRVFKTIEAYKRHLREPVVSIINVEHSSAVSELHHTVSQSVSQPEQGPSRQQSTASPVVNTSSYKINWKAFDEYGKAIMIQAVGLGINGGLSNVEVNNFLRREQYKVELLARRWKQEGTSLIEGIPLTLQTAIKRLGLEADLVSMICCKSCFSIYPFTPETLDEAQGIQQHSKICTRPFYSSSKKFAKSKAGVESPICGRHLYEVPDLKTPSQLFFYQELKKWLGKRLCQDGFEDLLEANLSSKNYDPSEGMKDIWHGEVWQNFKLKGKDNTGIFTSSSGNLVFSLYVDWFNPRGNRVGGKSVSIGAIILICLNLPLEKRYLEENIYIFGITPGPREPKGEELNYLLQPLVDEFKLFQEGIWFSSTSRFPTGRLIKAVIFPLIADLPAMRKTAGFSGHSSTMFCSFCQAKRDEINNSDINSFTKRDPLEYKQKSIEWKNSKTQWERDVITKESGVKWSVLSELDYWRPIDFCVIEVMHSLVLGNLKDHCLSFLGLQKAAEELDKKKAKELSWQVSEGNTKPFLRFILTKARKRKSLAIEEDINQGSTMQKRKTEKPLHEKIRKGKRRAQSSEGSGSGISSSSMESRVIDSSDSKYNLRSRRIYEVNSDSEGGSDKTETVSTGPSLIWSEVEEVRKGIQNTIIPSWISRVPKNLGSRSAGSLKAAEWLVLYTVYFTLVLLPTWEVVNQGDQTQQRPKELLESTSLLVAITRFLTMQIVKEKDLHELEQMIMRYREVLQQGWPGHTSKPNIHITQHYPSVIRLFGPPKSTSAWTHERLNGILAQVPTNNQMKSIPQTIIKDWVTKSNLKLLLNNGHSIESLLKKDEQASSPINKQSIQLEPTIFQKWKSLILQDNRSSTTSLSTNVGVLSPNIIPKKSFDIEKKKFTTHDQHAGNSLIEYKIRDTQRYGQIRTIFSSSATADQLWVVVDPFKELKVGDEQKDPYLKFPDCNARLVRQEKGAAIVISTMAIIGHVAMLPNEPGTFHVMEATYSAVGLRGVVRLHPC